MAADSTMWRFGGGDAALGKDIIVKPLRVLSHPDCLGHEPGLGHPDTPARVQRLLEAVEPVGDSQWVVHREAAVADTETTLGVLRWIHDPGYLETIQQTVAEAPGHLDSPDCAVSAGSWRAITATAGLALQAALDAVNGRLNRAFIVARPPSHHAEMKRARGYCFVNSAALIAEVFCRASAGPVLVVDFDAHHGNGTQSLFWERPDVGFVSVHEWPAFPGTGAADEIGAGKGLGLTRNVPLAAESGDDVVATAVEHALEEMAPRIRPVSIVVSAGFSGHLRDPVANWRMSAEGFARISRALVQAADAFSGGRLISILEGGYDLQALCDCAHQHVLELAATQPVN